MEKETKTIIVNHRRDFEELDKLVLDEWKVVRMLPVMIGVGWPQEYYLERTYYQEYIVEGD